MASFIQTGDPNAHKITNSSVASVPGLDEGKQFLVQSQGVDSQEIGQLEERCAFWLSVASKVPI